MPLRRSKYLPLGLGLAIVVTLVTAACGASSPTTLATPPATTAPALAASAAASEPAVTAPAATQAAATTEQANSHITATIRICCGERGIVAYAFGSVWQPVDTAEVARVDPRTNKVMAKIPVGIGPNAAIGVFGSVWVTASGGSISRINPATNRVVATIKLGDTPFGIGVLDGSLWVVNGYRVSRIDPETNKMIDNIKVNTLPPCDNNCPAPFLDLATGAGAVWVASFRSRVFRIDPATNSVSGTVKLGPCCSEVQGVAVGFGSVWAPIDKYPGLIARIDPSSLKVTAWIRSGQVSPAHALAFGGKIWLGHATNNPTTIEVIDPATNKIATWAHVNDWSGPGAGGGALFGPTATTAASIESAHPDLMRHVFPWTRDQETR